MWKMPKFTLFDFVSIIFVGSLFSYTQKTWVLALIIPLSVISQLKDQMK